MKEPKYAVGDRIVFDDGFYRGEAKIVEVVEAGDWLVADDPEYLTDLGFGPYILFESEILRKVDDGG